METDTEWVRYWNGYWNKNGYQKENGNKKGNGNQKEMVIRKKR